MVKDCQFGVSPVNYSDSDSDSDWTHHTFISYFLHILGAGEKSSPQETKCSTGFSANIADMRIPFQIICNCYTKVFDIIHIFENRTF